MCRLFRVERSGVESAGTSDDGRDSASGGSSFDHASPSATKRLTLRGTAWPVKLSFRQCKSWPVKWACCSACREM